MAANKELAFEAFKAEFVRNGFDVPKGLINLLKGFTLKPNESAEEGRARIYRRLWALLWFGSQKKLGASPNRSAPTYVYPPSLKRVIREIIPGNIHDKSDPNHDGVCKVNIGELATAKWPVAKKK